ncbi:3776_t:CDS:10 [Funneliformis geosporum]|uniref:3776_t:CDS:1 n=1 Tax=Funneliformis geosporum TaxID=1117311 RepID=A0A9W4SRN7_9GLOM|nr:3776_t:CDS:10 [Funneliformis geosporum]
MLTSSKHKPATGQPTNTPNNERTNNTPINTSKSYDSPDIPVTSNSFNPSHLYPSWETDSSMDLRVYISEDENFADFKNLDVLKWHASSIQLGNWDDERDKSVDIQTSVNVRNNGTLYAHIYLTLNKASPDPTDPSFQENMRTNPSVIPIVSYWHQNLTLNIISDNTVIPYRQLTPVVASHIQLDTTTLLDPSSKAGYYLPVLIANDFWILREHLTPINETVETQAEMMGGDAHSEFDEIKRMLRETNPILLGVTFTVSLFHSIFEFLAFKNDIAHWKNKEELTGVSVRSILLNIFFQLIIFLYLMDNNHDTSWMILIGQGISVAIEVWKIKKAVDVKIIPSQGFFKYSIKFVDKHKLSESEEKTKEYDRLAFKYLSWIAYPLLTGYAIYSLVYNTHKSWYSFVLSTLVGFVYAFGFIMMTPQLFINYKLKSVAHMPWKTLMYKTLGTFVDDLFAFCIKMPTLHRLACLRDDVVFFVYLYQKWKYPDQIDQGSQPESKKDK